MKRFILFTIAILILTLSFSQNNNSNSSFRNSSFITEKHNAPELRVYPNPCKGEKITIDFSTRQIAEVQLTNITGKQVLSKKFNFAESKKQVQLNDIPNGMYLLKIRSVDNKSVVKKLIISKK